MALPLASPAELTETLHALDVRQETGVLLLPDRLAADVVGLQGSQPDAMATYQIRGESSTAVQWPASSFSSRWSGPPPSAPLPMHRRH